MKFEFRRMSGEEARQIAGWRSDPPYDSYDAVSDPDDLAELLDARRRGEDYFSAFDEKGRSRASSSSRGPARWWTSVWGSGRT